MSFVIANTGQGGKGSYSDDLKTLHTEQLSITDPKSRNFVENTAHVDTGSMWRAKDISPKDELYHWNWNAETAFLIGQAMGNAMIGLTCPSDPCNTAAKTACASANMLDCISGATTCGACKSGFKASGNTCTALAACETYKTSISCDRRRCDFYEGECYKKEKATPEGDTGKKAASIKGCFEFKKQVDCDGTPSGGRCEWGVEDDNPGGECWDREATATGGVEGDEAAAGRRGRQLSLPKGFTQLENGEIGGPLSKALVEAFFMCDFLPAYDWLEISDWWITSVSGTSPLEIGYSLIFPLTAIAKSDYAALAGAVRDMLKACQSAGKLTENLKVTAKKYQVEPLTIIALKMDSTVKINRLKTGRAGSKSGTEISILASQSSTTAVLNSQSTTPLVLNGCTFNSLSTATRVVLVLLASCMFSCSSGELIFADLW